MLTRIKLLIVLAIMINLHLRSALMIRAQLKTTTTTKKEMLKGPINQDERAKLVIKNGFFGLASFAAAMMSVTRSSKAETTAAQNKFRNVYGEDEPIVQGVIDLSDSSQLINDNSHVLIEVFDAENRERDLLAGAKLAVKGPGFDNTQKPFRFQLYQENLLVAPKVWEGLGDFDQKIVISLCSGDIKRSGWCRDKSLSRGDGLSKVVKIGSNQDRQLRLFPLIKVTPTSTAVKK